MRRHISQALLCLALFSFALVDAHAQATPHLEDRANPPDPQPPLDARITPPVTIPSEAFGHYSFGRELDLLEIDLEPRGLTGYITLLGEKGGPDKNAPLTFFFIKTRTGGDNVYFLTQQIHRVSYEFSGSLQQSAPREKTLDVDYSLVGTLTVHHAAEPGTAERKESRQVTFKKVQTRLR